MLLTVSIFANKKISEKHLDILERIIIENNIINSNSKYIKNSLWKEGGIYGIYNIK